MSQRIFISHRNVDEDLRLAQSLHDGLQLEGHQVFLDAADLQPGDEWPTVIKDELEQADVLVVLLSRHIAAHPDMVIEEVSMARELRRRRQGRPRIVPVCLGDGVIDTLPYDLAAMVKRLQYARWAGPEDNERLLGELQRVFASPLAQPSTRESRTDWPATLGVPAAPAEAAPAEVIPTRGMPTEAVVERPPPQPPKTRYSSYWYVTRADAEREAEDFLREPGSPVVLVGPGDIGKSYFLDHLLEVHGGEGDSTVRINLDFIDDEALESSDELFRELAFEMVDQLELDEAMVDKAWERKKRRPAGTKLRHFMKSSALPGVEGRLFLVIDRADAVAASEAAAGLFRELRRWAELSGRSEPWDRLRMLLAISTEPGRLLDTLESSPFNISPPIRLDDLDREQLMAMARCYGLALDDAEIAELTSLVGGHPYLARKVMYHAAADKKPVTELLRDATDSEGLFADHLRSRMLKVKRVEELTEALRLVIHGDLNPIDADVAHRLLSSGLIAGGPGEYRMRYELYQRYFSAWLKE